MVLLKGGCNQCVFKPYRKMWLFHTFSCNFIFRSSYKQASLHFSRLFSSLFSLSLSLSFASVPAGLIISLQLLRGDMEQVRRENPLIFSRGVAITRKLGFPDVIMPGESLYFIYFFLGTVYSVTIYSRSGLKHTHGIKVV